MIKLNVQNETSRLRSVVLGIAVNNGPTPNIEDCYDPKSRKHILSNSYPIEADMVKELEAVLEVFKKYDVKVYRPEVIPNCNQIFARDIAFVIDDFLIEANLLPNREEELKAIDTIWNIIPRSKHIKLPEHCHIEGGDVMLVNNHIFIGTYSGANYADFITARTNRHAVEAIKELFPTKIVKTFELKKSNTNAEENALHLDCCFNPLGKGKAIIHKNGFLVESEYNWLVNFFGEENVFQISKEEMSQMYSNVFSISEDVIISEKGFTRLNTWLKNQGFTVEEVPYAQIAKQGGLLRCTTMPLLRDNI